MSESDEKMAEAVSSISKSFDTLNETVSKVQAQQEILEKRFGDELPADAKEQLAKLKTDLGDAAAVASEAQAAAEAVAKSKSELSARVEKLERRGVSIDGANDPEMLAQRVALTESLQEIRKMKGKGFTHIFGDETDASLASPKDVQRLDAAFKRYAMQGNGSIESFGLTETAPDETLETGIGSFAPRYGILVPPAMVGRMLTPLFTAGTMFGLATERTVNTNIAKLMRFEGKVSIKRGADSEEISFEGGNLPEAYSTQYPIQDLAAIIELGRDIQEDSATDLVNLLTMQAQEAYMEDVGWQHINGTGARGEMVGVLNPHGGFDNLAVGASGLSRKTLDGKNAADKVVAVKTGSNTALGTSTATDSTFNFDPFITAVNSLHSRYRSAGVTALMNRMTLSAFSTMKNRDGDYQMRADATAGAGMTIMGIPARVNDQMPDIAASAYPVVVGAWSHAYEIATRRGVFMLRNPYIKESVTRWSFHWRLGARPADQRAYRALQCAT